MTTSSKRTLGWSLALGAFFAAASAQAGVPECGNVRLEDAGSCEIKGSVQCQAGCSELGVYKKACATKLHTVCRSECTLSADATCTDSCTERCSADCDIGVNVICVHNCFGECVGACDVKCAAAEDREQCQATCEATCDGECDIKCKPLVDGDCYQHCIECCGGSCTAQANMDCQTTCQDEEFEECEYEFRAECDGSCSGSGALFCDGEYVLSGEELPACVNALVARGIGAVDLRGEASLEVKAGDVDGGCSVAGAPGLAGRFAAWALVPVLLGVRRRRERAAR
jgi:hypothetical protein